LADYLQGYALLSGEITHQARCWLDRAVMRIEQELQHQINPREDYQLLQSVPGIGAILGTTIALETGTIGRFASAGNYASYARCVKSDWPGRLWKRDITARSGTPELNDTISARKPKGTSWWRKRQWPINSPGLAITC